jgi:hypothetical protein
MQESTVNLRVSRVRSGVWLGARELMRLRVGDNMHQVSRYLIASKNILINIGSYIVAGCTPKVW